MGEQDITVVKSRLKEHVVFWMIIKAPASYVLDTVNGVQNK